MNAIKIAPSLPYSMAHEMFVLLVAWAFDFNHQHKVNGIIEALKENWVMLTTDTRELILERFAMELSYKSDPQYHKMLTEFITWANQNRDNTLSTPQPLNAFIELPVVNQKNI